MDREQIGVLLKRLRTSRNISQTAIAEAIHVKQNTVSAYEHGAIDVLPKLPEIAKFLNVPMSVFFGEEKGEIREPAAPYNMPPGAIPLSSQEYVFLPVFAKIPCSLPEYSEMDISTRQPVPKFVYTMLYQGAEFVVIAKGDSMAPTINEGALCYIKPATTPINGAIMLVKFEGSCHDGFTIKIVRLSETKVHLEPINKKHKVIECKDGTCQVIGEVVGISQPAPRF